MEIRRIFDLLQMYREQFHGKEDALAAKVDGSWNFYSSEQYIEMADAVSCGFLAMGMKKGDKIATVTPNRPEWNFLDMGMAQTGIVHVPMFTNLEQDGYRDLLAHSEAKMVFVGNKALYKTIAPLVHELPELEQVYVIDKMDDAPHWEEVLRAGEKDRDKLMSELEEVKSSIKEDDPLTLIYTSGTTGTPKGVLLSHRNLITTARAASGVFRLQPDERYLSILPVCHVGERMANYQCQYSGCSIYYAENLGTIARDLVDVRPQGFGAVPRILEKVYEKIISKGSRLTGIKRKLFFWSLDLGKQFGTDKANGAGYRLKLAVARKLVFSKWRAALGGNVKAIGIGGAALQPQLERIFWAAGIKLLNMYGLTETSPIITINRQGGDMLRLGTVGKPIEGVQVKCATDGEILCKGPNVMIGYYKDDEATRAVLDKDGWFHTGDVGVLEDGFLKITDRKKEIFKLSNGKYVQPQYIENMVKESLFIDQLCVIGEGEKYASAIISPNMERLKEWCADEGPGLKSTEEMIGDARVIVHYKSIIDGFNKSLSKDEKLKRCRLVADQWTVESGVLSPTLKLKRRVIHQRYANIIGEIYQDKQLYY